MVSLSSWVQTPVVAVGRGSNNRLQNNGLQLTRSARCAPFAFRSGGSR